MEKLDTYNLRIALAKINKNYSWLAKQMGFTRQYIHHIVKTGSTKHIDKIAKILDLDIKDLIN